MKKKKKIRIVFAQPNGGHAAHTQTTLPRSAFNVLLLLWAELPQQWFLQVVPVQLQVQTSLLRGSRGFLKATGTQLELSTKANCTDWRSNWVLLMPTTDLGNKLSKHLNGSCFILFRIQKKKKPQQPHLLVLETVGKVKIIDKCHFWKSNNAHRVSDHYWRSLLPPNNWHQLLKCMASLFHLYYNIYFFPSH